MLISDKLPLPVVPAHQTKVEDLLPAVHLTPLYCIDRVNGRLVPWTPLPSKPVVGMTAAMAVLQTFFPTFRGFGEAASNLPGLHPFFSDQSFMSDAQHGDEAQVNQTRVTHIRVVHLFICLIYGCSVSATCKEPLRV